MTTIYFFQGGKRFLRCDQDVTSGGECINGRDCPHFYNMLFSKASSPSDVDFQRGGTYYLIGRFNKIFEQGVLYKTPWFE